MSLWDGTNWEIVRGLDDTRMNAVIRVGAIWIAVGTSTVGAQDVPAVWRSDGRPHLEPRRRGDPGTAIGGGPLACVATNGDVIVAGGSLNGKAAAWRSNDGINWVPIDVSPSRGGVPAAAVEGVSVGPDGSFVLVGGTRTIEGPRVASVWHSP